MLGNSPNNKIQLRIIYIKENFTLSCLENQVASYAINFHPPWQGEIGTNFTLRGGMMPAYTLNTDQDAHYTR